MLRERQRLILTDRSVRFEGDGDEIPAAPDREFAIKLSAETMAFSSTEVSKLLADFMETVRLIWMNIEEYRDIREARQNREPVPNGAAAELRAGRRELEKQLAQLIEQASTQIADELRR
jgi:hypothetical protein